MTPDIEKIREAMEQLIREMDAGFGSSFGETREMIRRALPIAQRLEAALPAVVEALTILYEETADYIRINNLGDVHQNRSMRMARDALALLEKKP